MDDFKRKSHGAHDAITVMGTLPEDPDLVPITPPTGIIWITGGTWFGAHGGYGIADMHISLHGRKLDLALTRDDAVALRSLLDQAIDAMGRDDDAVEKED